MERDLQEIKEEVRARSDIVEVISQYTSLKRAGKNWTGLCPFHADKKPSFNVSPALQIYKCWSCGVSGDVFKFVQAKENLDFIEALEFLARRAGIPFERKGVDKERASEREQMLELNLVAARFFQDRLTKSPDAQEYLAKRAILKPTQEQWDLGFAPPDWEGLAYFLQQKRADLMLAAKIGLIKARKEEGHGYYDTFRNRLMFPIHDMNGRIIAFGGRDMSGESEAKYLNSEQSAVFDKSRTLYGLYFARKKLGGNTPPVFVEGYVDVVTTHQAGFTQCVATLGTSMTEEHARMLVRYSPRVIICYDGDTAGIKATLRGVTVWESIGVEGADVRVARLPAGEDPDSLLRSGETTAFQAALDQAVPRVEFQLELALKRHDLDTDAGRDAALAEVIPILASIRSLTLRDRYAQQVARLHPSYRYNVGRAIEQLLADAETYARQTRNAQSPRDKGYPLTEEANRAPLNQSPPPPTYRPPDPQNWGRWPMTREVTGKGDYGANGPYERGKGGYNRQGKRRFENGPASDPTPPPLTPPALTGPEKAERTLLRALFSGEWRAFILSRLHPDYLITTQGRALFERIARTPANSEGGIDPLPLLRQVESEEPDEDDTPEMDAETGFRPDFESEWLSAPPLAAKTAKLSRYIREVLEDSSSLMSNEPLNEAAVTDCIRRLQRHRQDQDSRELSLLLQRIESLPPDQQRACIQQYHQRMREMRGSPPTAEGQDG